MPNAAVLVNGQATAVTATDLIEPQLVTIPNIEMCAVGEEWQLASGPLTLTTEHLQAAAEAYHNDPAVHAPRVRFGHTTAWPVASEPAFGTYQNLRVEDDGMTLVGDLVGVPSWFKTIASSAFPSRSMDGWTDATTHTGKTHALVIEAMSFLGVVLPGINTLEDLAGVWSADMPEGTEVSAGTKIHATRGGGDVPKPVEAAVGTDDLRKAFYEQVAVGDNYWWWIRQTFLEPPLMIVDDDEGTLYAMGYTVSADTVTFDEPEEIFTQYIYTDSGKVAASAATARAVPIADSQPAAVYASAAESRPQDRTKEDGNVAKPATASTLSVSREDLIKRLALKDDATDEDITTALAAEPEEEQEAELAEDDKPAAEGDEATAAKPPAGTRIVDDKAWEDTQARLAKHDAEAAKRALAHRDATIATAAREGRIPRSRAQHYAAAWDRDPEGTETLLTAAEDKGGLAKNLVPVEEIGVSGGDDVTASGDDATQERYYNTYFPELAKAGKE